MTTRGWYVIKTNPQCERKAAGELRREGMRVYIPTRSFEQRNRRTRAAKVIFRPLLIGYLFVRFPADLIDRGVPMFAIARACQGVKEFVRVANGIGEWEPIAIPEAIVSAFMRRQRSREFGRPEVFNRSKRMAQLRDSFRPGASYQVADGPFEGMIATLRRLNENETLDMEITIFGRPTRVSLGIPQVQPLANQREAA